MTPDQNQGTSTQDPQTVIVPGPFGGQLPVPPIDLEGSTNNAPSFQFSSDDFGLPAENTISPNTSPLNPSDIADPFAGGVQSLQGGTTPDATATIIEGNNEIPTFDSPSVPEFVPMDITKTPVVENTNNFTTLSDLEITTPIDTTLPIIKTTSDIAYDIESPISQDTSENTMSIDTITEANNQDIAANTETIAVNNEDIDTIETQEPTVEISSPTDTTIPSEFPIQEIDQIIEGDNTNVAVEETAIPQNNTTISSESQNFGEIEEIQKEYTTAPSSPISEELIPAVAVQEVYNPETHPVIETYLEFEKQLDKLLTLKGTQSIIITAHRTNEEEIQYEFNKQDESTTIIKHHHLIVTDTDTSQTLIFTHENGLQVKLNDESIANYGTGDNEDTDMTYYLKDKLNKFITIVSDEYTQEDKKRKEEKDKKKKYLEVLRAF